ncbi:MAG TPA: AI-2E family transporter [Thermoanaerobaculia bacterium]|nr:AI-2E family transporter [Thermoanaerobaculia bacterium]
MSNELLLKIEKWVIWGSLIGILFLLRHLFPIFFLTFVLTYIGNTVVNLATRRFPYRRVNLGITYIALIFGLVGVGLLVIPRILQEGRQLARYYIQHDIDASETERQLQPIVTRTLTSQPDEAAAHEETVIEREARKFLDSALVQLIGRDTFDTYRDSDSYQALIVRLQRGIANGIPKILEGVRIFVNGSIVIAFHFLLSIIFSFLILWDFPAIKRSIRSFSIGPTAEIYAEIAPGIRAFGVMLGRAFEAQTGIAFVNSILTSVGFLFLGVPSIALLAAIVFFCSYIPVFGVILSTLPAALLALKVGGVTLVFWLVVMILIVHAIEAYALNPLIYGHQLRMHPVAVLLILLIGEHLFGIWGLLLGVPVAAFLFKYALKHEDPTMPVPMQQAAPAAGATSVPLATREG